MDNDFGLRKKAGTYLTLACLSFLTLCLIQIGSAQSDSNPDFDGTGSGTSCGLGNPATPSNPSTGGSAGSEERSQGFVDWHPPLKLPTHSQTSGTSVERVQPEPPPERQRQYAAPLLPDNFNLGFLSPSQLGLKTLPWGLVNPTVPDRAPWLGSGPVTPGKGVEIALTAERVKKEYGLRQLHDLPRDRKLTPEEWRAWFDDTKVNYSEDTDVHYPPGSGIGTKPNGVRCSDCSHFVYDVLTREGLDVPYVTAHRFERDKSGNLVETEGWIGSETNSRFFEKIEPPAKPQPGDVILAIGVAQKCTDGTSLTEGLENGKTPRYGDDAHMGIYQGENRGTQMGKSGRAQTITWGTNPAGYTGGILAREIYYYRPIRI